MLAYMKKFGITPLPLLVLISLSLIGCSSSQDEAVADRFISSLKNHFAPDSRVALFDIKAENDNGGLVLSGETNLPDAKAALLDSLANRQIEAADQIRLLPAEELEGKIYGVVRNSVANVRSEPSHPAQLATQALMGMPLKVLKKDGGWYLVQTPDDYLSWIDGGGLTLMNKEEFKAWKSAAKLIYLSTFGAAYDRPSATSARVSDLVAGNIVKLAGTRGNYYKAEFPDGRTAFVRRSEARPFDEWKTSLESTEESLVTTAKTMTGVPYLWGGTSTKGVDCSGFTKTIFFMNGWVIPRDASQQVRAGEVIDTSEGFDNLRPGDLLFFGSSPQRVTHVGMWIGNNEFIHSSGRVRVSSVDPEAENFDEFNTNRFLEAKRYLGHKQGNIINVAEMYELDV